MPIEPPEDRIVDFARLPIPQRLGHVKMEVYHVIENGRPVVMAPFSSLDGNSKDKAKDLIIKMATHDNYLSPGIKHHLKGYNYGEIRPLPHRFFFFTKQGKYLIFFGHVEKKKQSLGDSFYKRLNKDKERYERAFEIFIERNR